MRGDMLRSSALPTTPVMVAGIDLLPVRGKLVVRAMATDGAVGYAFANSRLQVLVPILEELVIPYFVGKDARQLAALVDGVYAHQSNYKLAGLAFWNHRIEESDHIDAFFQQTIGHLLRKRSIVEHHRYNG